MVIQEVGSLESPQCVYEPQKDHQNKDHQKKNLLASGERSEAFLDKAMPLCFAVMGNR